MTKSELRHAFADQVPVIFSGSIGAQKYTGTYAKITAIIQRWDGGQVITQAEILDKQGNAVLIVRPEDLSRAP